MKKKFTSIFMLLVLAFLCIFAGCTQLDDSSSETVNGLVAYEISVCYDDNSAVNDVLVTVSLKDTSVTSGKTDENGKITFELEPNEYTVSVTPPDNYSAEEATTDTLGTPITIKLQQTAASGDQIPYTFYVLNAGGLPIEDVTVKIVEDDGTTVLKSADSNEDGLVLFYLDPDSYNVTLDNVPNGYKADKQYKSTDNIGSTVTFTLTPSLLEGQTMPEGTKYTYGSVMYDFQVPLCDGTTFSLYEALKTKKMVLVNFWYTTCGPCASEFPVMDVAYGQYSDSVEVVCISTDSDDTLSTIAAYKQQRNLTYLKMGSDTIDLYGKIRGLTGAVPVTLIIDRNGVLCQIHVGSQIDVSFFTDIFDEYIRDGYTTSVSVGKNSTDSGNEETERDLPTTTMPESSKIEALINNTASGYTFSYYNYPDDEYSWPWVISDEEFTDASGNVTTQTVFHPSNVNKGYSYSILCSTFQAKKGQVLAFDYWMQTEEDYDEVYVQIDGVIQHVMSGGLAYPEWETCYAFVAPENGTYELTILYNKDQQGNYLADTIYVKNMRFLDKEDVEVDTYIKRYAATKANEKATGATWGSVPQYLDYVTPVYNTTDGYYHVGTADGPLLLADLMYQTPWSKEYTIWNLAYADYFVSGGYNLKDEIEGYAWQQNNSDLSVLATPVDDYLQYLIQEAMSLIGFEYDNAWLEVCLYYNYYGPKGETYQLANPIAGIDFASAIDVKYESGALSEEGDSTTFKVDVTRILTPRGFKYKFVPEVTGIYQIESISTASDAMQDTYAWIFNEKQEIIAENNEAEFSNGYNFGFRIHLDANELYYLACCYFDVSGLGSYEVKITYLGESIIEMQVGASYYAYDSTGAEYLQDAVDYMLYDDGYYYVRNEDGSKGALLYINFFAFTKFSYLPTDLRDYINTYAKWTNEDGTPKIDPETNKPYYSTTEQGFNFKHMTDEDGNPYPDYLSTILEYLELAESVSPDDKFYGYLPANEELAEIIMLLFNNSKESNLENHWLILAYYETTV